MNDAVALIHEAKNSPAGRRREALFERLVTLVRFVHLHSKLNSLLTVRSLINHLAGLARRGVYVHDAAQLRQPWGDCFYSNEDRQSSLPPTPPLLPCKATIGQLLALEQGFCCRVCFHIFFLNRLSPRASRSVRQKIWCQNWQAGRALIYGQPLQYANLECVTKEEGRCGQSCRSLPRRRVCVRILFRFSLSRGSWNDMYGW